MVLQLAQNVAGDRKPAGPNETREQVKAAVRQKIEVMLHAAKDLPPDECLREVRKRLLEAQKYCQSVKKNFIFVEKSVTCDQYGLGGNGADYAILFRGPSEDASVAICLTDKGSLLHRNDSPWRVYRHMDDIDPV